MTDSAATSLREAIRRLHREKNAAYRDAWKKRGEVISILANVARKVDRLEYALDGAPPGRDETLLDTAVDLLVYCIKYETYLADIDLTVADTLFGNSELDRSFSQGHTGFEYLLWQFDMSVLRVRGQTVEEGIFSVVAQFDELQACFVGMAATYPPTVRLHYVRSLADAAARLVVALYGETQGLVR